MREISGYLSDCYITQQWMDKERNNNFFNSINGVFCDSEQKVERHKISKSQAISIFLLTGFLGIVFASTVFNRETSVRSYELMPFWSWRQIIFKTDKELLIEVLLNCVLLFPMGVLLPFIFEKS